MSKWWAALRQARDAISGNRPTDREVQALADATAQLLDDMGETGQCVCLLAKAHARIAYEPFRNGEILDWWISLEEAEKIVSAPH